jgi:hypothetical protein
VFHTFQDGAERVIESLSLIDAVMPDVVESRKQAAQKQSQIKNEPNNTNGEEGAHSLSRYPRFVVVFPGIEIFTNM